MITIPMINAPYFKFSTVLTENEYLLNFRWNTRAEFWTMDIYDLEEVPIILGIKLVIGYPLLSQRKYLQTCPPGEFWVFDPSLDTLYQEPGRQDFVNDRGVILVYVGDDE